MIYFDSAATTAVLPEVFDAMVPYFTDKWQNPSSRYPAAQDVNADIERARETIAASINASPDEIYFTSGGSEANCWAIQGFIKAHKDDNPLIITTDIEHHSILECVKHQRSWDTVGVDEEGFVSVAELERSLYIHQNREVLVSIQYANNEIGTIQNIKRLASICHRNGATIHTDAVQAFGNMKIDVKDIDVDMISVSGHKIGAPKGIGFLYIKKNTKIEPIIYGSQENALRGGTENVPYIIGLAKAVELLSKSKSPSLSAIRVRDYMIGKLWDLGCSLNGPAGKYRLANNINVMFSDVSVTSEQLVRMFGECGICCSAGSACNEGNPKPSHVLLAIGLHPEMAEMSIRFSLPKGTTEEDVDNAMDIMKGALKLVS